MRYADGTAFRTALADRLRRQHTEVARHKEAVGTRYAVPDPRPYRTFVSPRCPWTLNERHWAARQEASVAEGLLEIDLGGGGDAVGGEGASAGEGAVFVTSSGVPLGPCYRDEDAAPGIERVE